MFPFFSHFFIHHLFDYLQAILVEELNFNVCCFISRLPASVLKKSLKFSAVEEVRPPRIRS